MGNAVFSLGKSMALPGIKRKNWKFTWNVWKVFYLNAKQKYKMYPSSLQANLFMGGQCTFGVGLYMYYRGFNRFCVRALEKKNKKGKRKKKQTR